MEKIQFDSGLKRYKLGQGVLQFNPNDPNVYARFLEAVDKLKDLETQLGKQAQVLGEDGAALVQLMQDADKKMKQTLDWVFGSGNDFDAMLGGVNLLAVAENGERVATNLFAALEPVMVAGAESCAAGRAAQAVRKAQKRRGEQTAEG
ncbi:MAG: hypothetical protein IJB11_07045 [Oscillospiraceae bacterium]|nr:hypothetical protein [Oscillospiraceae bacterium]MBQ6839402.1 hypothetical protein [Oscillospiraceae bacterium]